MNPILIRNITRFLVLLFLQVLVINHVQLSSVITPFIYILALMVLPFNTPRWTLLVSAFFLGFFVDLFSGTMGLHMSATLVIAFARPTVLQMITVGREFDEFDEPNMRNLGIDWFLAYASTMIVLHHATLFFLETFRFTELTTLLRIFYSSVGSLGLIVLWQFLFGKRK